MMRVKGAKTKWGKYFSCKQHTTGWRKYVHTACCNTMHFMLSLHIFCVSYLKIPIYLLNELFHKACHPICYFLSGWKREII